MPGKTSGTIFTGYFENPLDITYYGKCINIPSVKLTPIP